MRHSTSQESPAPQKPKGLWFNKAKLTSAAVAHNKSHKKSSK